MKHPHRPRGIAVLLLLSLLLASLFTLPLCVSADDAKPEIQGDASRLTVDKSVYAVGEPIMVSGVGSGTDWVGIYRPDGNISIRWFYVDSAKGGPGSGVAENIRETPNVNEIEPTDLPPGTYIIRLMANDSSNFNDCIAWTTITIKSDVQSELPEISGDASRLTVNKTQFEFGEPIMVSGVGSGADWLGIYRVGAPHSIRWTYVDTARGGPGSGVEVNMRTLSDVNSGEPVTIPAGTYIIRLMANDSSNFADCIAWTTITVVGGEDIPPSAPVSATYALKNDTDGYAAGTVTVKMPADDMAGRCIVMYWGDENGKLGGYTALGRVKVTGETTSFTFGENVIIPRGATRLLVYAMNDVTETLSETFVAVELPQGAAHGGFEEALGELFVMSDIHITLDKSHAHNQNFANMLKDVQSLSKDALGIFVVGDTADTGNEQEYVNMVELHQNAGDVPPVFLAIGNHDLSSLPFDQANANFLKYATLPDGSHPTDTSYDFWLGGYHFIFLGTDTAAGLHASFNRETMNWLKDTIEENRDPSRPVFLFLHQSLSDTVSGSLPGEGWNGVDNEGMLRSALKNYPEVMFFNGHSHWTMDSTGNMFEGSDQLPCRIFNCASVAYLWSGYNMVTGEHLEGSQGYMVKLCDGKLYVLGRDFARGEWIPSAQYCIVLADKSETEPPTETNTEAPAESLTDPATAPTPEPTDDATTPTSEPECTETPTTAPAGGCGSALLSALLVTLLLPAACLLRKRNRI